MSKIYNEIIIDMNPESPTFKETLYEDSYEYSGDIIQAQYNYTNYIPPVIFDDYDLVQDEDTLNSDPFFIESTDVTPPMVPGMQPPARPPTPEDLEVWTQEDENYLKDFYNLLGDKEGDENKYNELVNKLLGKDVYDLGTNTYNDTTGEDDVTGDDDTVEGSVGADATFGMGDMSPQDFMDMSPDQLADWIIEHKYAGNIPEGAAHGQIRAVFWSSGTSLQDGRPQTEYRKQVYDANLAEWVYAKDSDGNPVRFVHEGDQITPDDLEQGDEVPSDYISEGMNIENKSINEEFGDLGYKGWLVKTLNTTMPKLKEATEAEIDALDQRQIIEEGLADIKYKEAGLTYEQAGRTYERAGLAKETAEDVYELGGEQARLSYESGLSQLQNVAPQVGTPTTRSSVAALGKVKKGFETGVEQFQTTQKGLEKSWETAQDVYNLAGQSYGTSGIWATDPGPDGIIGTEDDVATDTLGTYGLAAHKKLQAEESAQLAYDVSMEGLRQDYEKEWEKDWDTFLFNLPSGA